MGSGKAIPGVCAIRRPREGCGVLRVHSDAVSACTVHPIRLGETAGMPPVAGFPASGHGPYHRPAYPSCHSGQAQSSEGRFLPAVSPRPRRRPLGNSLVAFVVRADPNPIASFCPSCLPPRYAARMLNSSGCGGVVGFTPVPRNLRFLVCERDAKRLVNAVNGGAFSSNFLVITIRHFLPADAVRPRNDAHRRGR